MFLDLRRAKNEQKRQVQSTRQHPQGARQRKAQQPTATLSGKRYKIK
jgi:hypothetical protein